MTLRIGGILMAGFAAMAAAGETAPRQADFTVPVAVAAWQVGTRAQVADSTERTPDDEATVLIRLAGDSAPDQRFSEQNSLVLTELAGRPRDLADWRVMVASFWLKPLTPSPEPLLAVLRRGYGETVPLAGNEWRRVEIRTWGPAPLYLREVHQLAFRTALPPAGTAFLIGPVQFRVEERLLRWRPAAGGDFTVNGLWWLKENEGAFIRLPRRVAEVNRGVWNCAQHPAGGRIRFRTDSTTLKLRVDHGNDGFPWPMMSSMAMAGIELYEGPPGDSVFRWVATPVSAKEPYELSVPVPTDGKLHEYTLYLPMYAKLATFDLGLDPEARLEPPGDFRQAKPIVFYGTSFVQGGCASRGSMNFPAIVGRRLGMDIVNLGFAGDGQCEPEIGECMAGIDASCFVMGPILNNLPLMRQRYAPFVDSLRRRWPETPILLMTRLHTVGQQTPYAVNGLVREVHDTMRAAGDRNVHLFDSFALYQDGGFYPTADGVHPSDYGFMLISDALAPALAEILGLAGQPTIP
jgi:hypothetical protein